MTPSQQHFVQIKGMHKDFNQELPDTQYAYDIQNMRLTSLDEENLLSLINEKGNIKVDLYNCESPLASYTIEGKCIGSCTINNNMVLFVVEEFTNPNSTMDYIYRIYKEGNKYYVHKLLQGNFGFDKNHPIECITFFETEDVQKVYWIDGVNQLRYLNIKNKQFYNESTGNPENYVYDVDKNFNVLQMINAIPALYDDDHPLTTLSVAKQPLGGYFKSGVIQYAITFSYKNGSESNIVATSPLYYITYGNTRGLSPEDTSTNSFLLNITIPQNYLQGIDFDYVNIYSIHRTSINAAAECKLVEKLRAEQYLTYVDTGNTGSLINETDLLALYQTPFTSKTFTEKTNTLILGNVSFLKDNLFNNIPIINTNWNNVDGEYFTSAKFTTGLDENENYKKIENNNTSNIYPYDINLDKSSWDITTYKYLEYYRFGIQVMDSYGTWSNPIWIGDRRNLSHPSNVAFYNNDNATFLPYFKAVINDFGINYLRDLHAVAIRPLVVFPTINDRICKAQGVLNPTVFNWKNRENGNVYSQASWCFRPNAPFDVYTLEQDNLKSTGKADEFYRNFNNVLQYATDENSLMGLVHPDRFFHPAYDPADPDPTAIGGNRLLGGWCEFRHHYPLTSNTHVDSSNAVKDFFEDSSRIVFNNNYNVFLTDRYCNTSAYKGTEIQALTGKFPLVLLNNNNVQYIGDTSGTSYNEWFFVDQSAITLNSPELEFEDNSYFTNFSDCDLRIVGAIPITGNMNALSVVTSGSTDTSDSLITTNLSINCQSRTAWRGLYSQPRWHNIAKNDELTPKWKEVLSNIYLWQWGKNMQFDTDEHAELVHKYSSSLKFSNNSVFLKFGNIWKPQINSYINYFNDNQDITQFYNIDGNLTSYKGNVVDAILTTGRGAYGTPKLASSGDISMNDNPVCSIGDAYRDNNHSTEITYKSSPHAFIKLGDDTDSLGGISDTTLPILKQQVEGIDYNCNTPYYISTLPVNEKYFWDSEGYYTHGSRYDIIKYDEFDYGNWQLFNGYPNDSKGMFCGFLWLGEIYDRVKEDSSWNDKRFGGNTESALMNNQWLVAGDTVFIDDETTSVTLRWLEGDTYYQRYDCLKTYPFTNEDMNQNVEILSFMCETHINLDGRYDRRRGMEDNTTARPENFNLMNPVYDQQPTFPLYRITEGAVDTWQNEIVLSRTKTSGELIDNWTKLNMANALDLNGTKGKISKLINFHDSVFAFQNHAISQIYYNEKEQLTTESGLAVQLANSNKLDGYKVLFDKIGCSNKWSVCVTTRAVYFIDDENKSIYMWGGGGEAPINITDKNGFNSWIRKALAENKEWTFDNFVTYDNNSTSDVYFVNKDYCLSFNELLNEFSSFYSYESTPYLHSINKEYFMLRNDDGFVTMWQQHSGDYNSFFGELKPFSITVLANDKGIYDKVFNTIDFRSNTWSNISGEWENCFNTDFKKIEVWTEYQHGMSQLNLRMGVLSELKKKYRLWHANIPRNNMSGNLSVLRDRIRNPWAYVKLSSDNDVLTKNKTVLNDIMVNSIII